MLSLAGHFTLLCSHLILSLSQHPSVFSVPRVDSFLSGSGSQVPSVSGFLNSASCFLLHRFQLHSSSLPFSQLSPSSTASISNHSTWRVGGGGGSSTRSFHATGHVHSRLLVTLKGLSHEIFRPVFWPVWMRLGLNVNCFWFYNFYEASSIFGSYFKFWCASYQTF